MSINNVFTGLYLGSGLCFAGRTGISIRTFSMMFLAIAVILSVVEPSAATHGPGAQPYAGTPNPVAPFPGPDLPTFREVTGKEFSDGRDRNAQGGPEVERVVAWDGLGGVRDAFRYAGSRLGYPGADFNIEVDGIANGGDALFTALRNDQASMVLSVEGDNQIYYVKPTGFPNALQEFGVWATATDIDAVHPPLDVDGLELWGPDQLEDADRYSLRGDPFIQLQPGGPFRKVSIWQYDATNHASSPHTMTADLAAAIDMLFGGPGEGGPLWGSLVEMMDVDAIMLLGQSVTFSIAPIDLSGITLLDGSVGPNFHGGEIFEYDGPGSAARFLEMGGYVWDYNLDLIGTFGLASNNINALEAVAVPEPATLILLGMGTLALIRRRRR